MHKPDHRPADRLSRQELEDAALACRGQAQLVRKEAEAHRGAQAEMPLVAKARRLEALAEKLDRAVHQLGG